MTTEQYSIGYDAGYQDGFDAALAEPVKQEPVARPNLQPVINWLENGCDPKEAAKELRIYQEQMKAAPVSAPKQEPVAWAYIDADGSFMDALDRQHGAYQTPLYAAPVDAKAIRAEALDKVVKFLSESGLITPTGRFAAAIRGLK